MSKSQRNRFGLKRSIAASIKHEIRQRSKYGCVICRCGIYQYEHIDPEFNDARKHDPEAICCLCGRCHDKVTRGILSKAAVRAAYQNVQTSTEIDRPREFFDFHTGEAKLAFGGLICDPTPESIFRYEGINLFSVKPGEANGEPGSVNAEFCDDAGKEQFSIRGNEWIGPTSVFDFGIVGQRFQLRTERERLIFRLCHQPPGLVILEKLDMRFKDVHLLASEHDFAIGRHNGHGNNLVWLHAKARIDQIFCNPVAVDIGRPKPLPADRDSVISVKTCGLLMNQSGNPERVLSTDPRLLEFHDPMACGIHWPGIGFQVAKGCEFAFSALAIGVCGIEHARKNFFMKNRMNVPALYLPAIINASKLKTERERLELLVGSESQGYLKEPFLVQEDTEGIRDWMDRQADESKRRQSGPKVFHDDKPGCYGAFGAIKLVDAYDGPACRVKRE